jgi:Tfp pilus assembly protein PilP
MKKAFLLVFAFLALVVVANGQTGQRQTPEQRHQTFMSEVKKQMKLSDEKLAKVDELYAAFYKDLSEMRQQGSFDREKMMQSRQKLSEKLAVVLTKAEHDKLMDIEASQRRQGRPTP